MPIRLPIDLRNEQKLVHIIGCESLSSMMSLFETRRISAVFTAVAEVTRRRLLAMTPYDLGQKEAGAKKDPRAITACGRCPSQSAGLADQLARGWRREGGSSGGSKSEIFVEFLA